MSKSTTIIRFAEAAKQTSGDITRVVGFIPAKHLISLFQKNILDANPRKPKVGRVTSEILDTLNETPELFQFKSKGVLIGTSNFKELQRNRYALNFEKSESEGILDGGHNMLSIGLHVIKPFLDEKVWKKIKTWEDLLEQWDVYKDDIYDSRDDLDFALAAELLIPSSSDPIVVENYRIASIDICAARNNNAQLALEAKANQKGFYDEIRSRFEKVVPSLAQRIEWKTNQWESEDVRPIKVRDLIALSWIPLSLLDEQGKLPESFKLPPQMIYSGKGKLSEYFDTLMANPEVTTQMKDGRYELHNIAIGSAFDILCDIPNIADFIVKNLPKAYNNADGKFGGIAAVIKPKHSKALTPFYQKEMDYKVPDGFVAPLVYGVKALLEIENGIVKWKTDPIKFLEENFDEIVRGFTLPMKMAGLDPQKVGKSEQSYEFAFKQYEFLAN